MKNIPDELLPEKIALYKIILPGKEPVYMTTEKSFDPELEAIVIVDAFRFIPLWSTAAAMGIVAGTPRKTILNTLRADIDAEWCRWKKEAANTAFAAGPTNPVPFAHLGRFFDDLFRLDDGNTRLIWLVLNGALAFPMTCSKKDEGQLIRLAGVE